MKKYLLLCLLFLNYRGSTLCLAQLNRFSLEVDIPDMQSGYAKLLLEGVSLDKDSAYKWDVKNGKVIINGTLPEHHPYMGWIWLNDSVVTGKIIISPDQANRISCNGKEFGSIPVDSSRIGKSSKILAEKLKLVDENETEPFFRQRDKIVQEIYHNNPPENVLDSFNSILQKISYKKDTIIKNYILDYPDSYIGLLYLYDRARLRGYSTELGNAFKYLNTKIQNSDVGKMTGKIFIISEKTFTGTMFPILDVLVDGTDSFTLNLSSTEKVNKKITLIDFWYSNCSPCIGQFDDLKSMYSKYHKKGFDIISISTDSKAKIKNWKNVILHYSLPWKQYLDVDGKSAENLNINFYPYNFLVNSKGEILNKNVSMVQLEKILGKY